MGPLSPDETTPLNFYWRHSTPREDLDMTPTRSLDRHQFESGTEPISSSPGSCGTKRRRKSRKKMFQDCESHKKGNNSFSGLNEKMESLQNFNSCDRDQNKVVSNYWRRILEFQSPIWIQLWILLVLLPSPGTRSEPQPLPSISGPRPLPSLQNLTSISSLTAGFSIPGGLPGIQSGNQYLSYNSGRLHPSSTLSTSSSTTPTVTSAVDGVLDEDYPFENNTYSNTTVPLGDTAFLKCTIKNLGEREVFWIRRRDMHIISVGKNVYTNDERFHVLNFENSDDWVLQIKYVQKRDNGSYECSVSTGKGIASYAVHVFVAVPEAFILGNGEYHIQEGSTINLVCIVEKSPKPPDYIFWYHNDRMINYDKDRNLRIQTETGSKTHSRLIIDNAQVSDSGNYTCHISNADPASTLVYISQGQVTGDKMAAIQRRKSSASVSNYFSDFLLHSQVLSILLLLIN